MNQPVPVRNISPKDLNQKLVSGEKISLIDVREEHERDICSIGGELIPKDTVGENLDRIPREGTVVVYCRSGGRSRAVVQALQDHFGFTNLWNLEGGILRWSDDVDTSITKY